MAKRSPDFIGIGVMKGGTTWTWRQMKKHPDIGTPINRRKRKIVKEHHFFDRLRMTLKQYKKMFGSLDTPLAGEFTPNYFSCPYGPPMVKELFPKVKLFTLLRNPTDRAFSHYKDYLFSGKIEDGISFIEAFDGGHSKRHGPAYTVKAKGMYGDLLEKWREYFDEDQLKVFFYDDLVENPVGFLKDVFSWVGADPNFVPPGWEERVVKRYNKAYDDLKMDPKDRKKVSDFYAPQVAKLCKLTGRNLSWS